MREEDLDGAVGAEKFADCLDHASRVGLFGAGHFHDHVPIDHREVSQDQPITCRPGPRNHANTLRQDLVPGRLEFTLRHFLTLKPGQFDDQSLGKLCVEARAQRLQRRGIANTADIHAHSVRLDRERVQATA